MTDIITEIETLNATITYREDLTAALAIIRVEPDEGEVPAFTPGQFCSLGLLRLDENGEPQFVHGKVKRVRRAYSIASSADERRYVEIYLARVEGGQLTPRVFSLNVGEKVFLAPKINGTFTLDNIPQDKNLVMLATGTGLSPYISMLRTCRDRGVQPWRRCVVVQGARFVAELGYHDELEAIAAKDESVTYLPTLSREPDDSSWQGIRGRLQVVLDDATFEERTGFALTPEDCHVLICGNPAMIASVEELLHQRGFVTHSKETPGQIHFERYW